MDLVLFITVDISLTLFFIYKFRKHQENKAMEYFMSLNEEKDEKTNLSQSSKNS